MKKNTIIQEKLLAYIKEKTGIKFNRIFSEKVMLPLLSTIPIVGLVNIQNVNAATVNAIVTSTKGSIKVGNFGGASVTLFDSSPSESGVNIININGEKIYAGNSTGNASIKAQSGGGAVEHSANNFLQKLNASDEIGIKLAGGYAPLSYPALAEAPGPWDKSTAVTGFIGFRFKSGEEGWIRVTFEGRSVNGSNRKLILHDFGYAINTSKQMLAGEPTYASGPTVSVENIMTPATENLKTALTYRFTRTGATTNPLAINFAITGTASADDFGIAAGAHCIIYDSTAKTGSITIPSGSTTVDLLVFPIGDAIPEEDETVIVSVAAP